MKNNIRTDVSATPDGYKVTIGITAYTLTLKELLSLLDGIVLALKVAADAKILGGK